MRILIGAIKPYYTLLYYFTKIEKVSKFESKTLNLIQSSQMRLSVTTPDLQRCKWAPREGCL